MTDKERQAGNERNEEKDHDGADQYTGKSKMGDAIHWNAYFVKDQQSHNDEHEHIKCAKKYPDQPLILDVGVDELSGETVN